MKIVPAAITQKLGRQILIAQKNSPRTLFVFGIGGVVVSTILACRATLKLDDKLQEFQNEVETVTHTHQPMGANGYHRNMVMAYAHGSLSLAKLYAPAIILGTASIAALTGSHVTLTRRNVGLTAAYSAVQASFDAYRERVKEELGPTRELEHYHAIKTEKVEIDKKMTAIQTADPNKWSPYAKFFDEQSINWTKDPELNRIFVQCQQNYLNHLLQARGHVFLNEAYDALGLERTQAGSVVGWLANSDGDGYIDFGLFETTSKHFIQGWERSVILDFNVDGTIYNKI